MKNKMNIITHRGLEPSKKDFYFESTYESFSDHIGRGFGIEFDPNFVKDGIIVFHDLTLKRLSDNNDQRSFSEVSADELTELTKSKNGRIPAFNEVLQLIEGSNAIHAMHLKGAHQTAEKVDLLVKELRKFPNIIKKIIIFDVKPKIASYMKKNFPELILAPSVAHEYDIKRYNDLVGGTLITADEAIKHKDLYDWVWLDEWDLLTEDGKKKLYTEETFEKLKKEGFKISLVTPELHSTSPGLLGGEAHKDASNKKRLFSRIREIVNLQPDAICTDYPGQVKELIETNLK
jgi:glycerophosphoryl diester phosphodiesterase